MSHHHERQKSRNGTLRSSFSILFCIYPHVCDKAIVTIAWPPYLSSASSCAVLPTQRFITFYTDHGHIGYKALLFIAINFNGSDPGLRGQSGSQRFRIRIVGSQSGIDLTTDSRFTNSACLALDESRAENGFGTHCHGLGLIMKNFIGHLC